MCLALLAFLITFLKILFLIERSDMQYKAKKKISFANNEICIKNTFYLNKSKYQKFVHYLDINILNI